MTIQTEQGPQTVPIIDGAVFKVVARHDFPGRVFCDYNEEHTDTETIAEFKAVFASWWSLRESSYKKLLEASLLEYEPLENYDRREEGGWTDTRTDNLEEKTNLGARKSTRTDNLEEKTEFGEKNNVSESDPSVVISTENFVAGDDSSTAVLASKTVVTPDATVPDRITATEEASTDTKSNTGTVTEEADAAEDKKTNTGTQGNKREFEGYRVHGNIGVTTSSALLKEFMEVQGAIDLGRRAIEEFIDLYTIYIE